jgi:hypothetical protein
MEARRLLDIELFTGLLREVKEKMNAGTAKPCMSVKLLEASADGSSDLTEVEMGYHASQPFTAGTSTVSRHL